MSTATKAVMAVVIVLALWAFVAHARHDSQSTDQQIHRLDQP